MRILQSLTRRFNAWLAPPEGSSGGVTLGEIEAVEMVGGPGAMPPRGSIEAAARAGYEPDEHGRDD